MKYSIIILIFLPWCCRSQQMTYKQAMLACDNNMLEMNRVPNKVNSNLYPYCLLGARIPNFRSSTTNNKNIDSNYFLGKITVLNFWLTTCPPCIAEIPGLNIIHDKFKDKKVNFLAIGKGSEKDKKSFLDLHPWNFDQIKNGPEVIDSVFKIKWGYPTTLILDKNMKIIQVFHGGYHDARAAEDIQNKIIPILESELKSEK